MKNEIILVDKPAGISSFGVVARVRRKLSDEAGMVSVKGKDGVVREKRKKVKVGHTGTLDPFATGLLILLTGKGTKRANEFLKLDKEYIATLRLGEVSTTGDPEGEKLVLVSSPSLADARFACRTQNMARSNVSAVSDKIAARSFSNDEEYALASSSSVADGGSIDSASLDEATTSLSEMNTEVDLTDERFRDKIPEHIVHEKPNKEAVEKCVEKFVGENLQRVPAFSAVKINGQRAYKLAREGKEVEMPVRKVMIYELEILSYEWPELVVRCKVSSGTYIRALAEDIGRALGTGAYLTALRRTKVGEYDVEDAEAVVE